ncbi:MAG: hypothetical protein WKF92_06855 [Pyrinomonadaceae bacterium]
MKKKILFFVCLSFLTALSFSAQTKTVTNSDLSKFRSQRLLAEKELRENYEKLGFPSPEELRQRQEKNRVETEELSAKLRAERIEREKLAAEIRRELALRLMSVRPVHNYNSIQNNGFYGGFISNGYYNRYSFNRFRHRRYSGPTWRADASGVVYEPGSRPAPIWTPRIFTSRDRTWRR